MSLSVIQGALELGLIFAIMSLGIFVSFRILNIPDLTVDGTFTLGTSVSAIFTVNGHPVLGVIFALLAGGLAGCATGFLQTKMKVQPILAGILTMTALYSVNLRVMGQKPNLSLFDKESIFSGLTRLIGDEYANLIMIVWILVVSIFAIFFFLKTQLGMSLRATGDNEDMVRASSINSDAMKIMGLAIANGFVALAGAILAQYQSFSDVSGGIGMMVVGLASIIVGEAIFGRKSIIRSLLAVVIGAVVYRFVLTIALRIGLEAGDLKLFSAILVTIAICIPTLKGYVMKRRSRRVKD